MHTNLWRWYYISAYGLRWLAWKRIWNRDDPAGRDGWLQGTHAAASMETIKPKHLTTSIILLHLICVRDGAINLKCHTTTYSMRYRAARGRQTGATRRFSEKMSYSRLLRPSVSPLPVWVCSWERLEGAPFQHQRKYNFTTAGLLQETARTIPRQFIQTWE